MKLLFVTYDFYPNFGANSLIIYNLAQTFIENGLEVHILPLKTYSGSEKDEVWEDIYIHREVETFDKKQVSIYLHKQRFFSAFGLLGAIIRDRFTKKEYLKRHWSHFGEKRLECIMTQYKIDIVISVCYPFESSLPVMMFLKKSKKRVPWIIYMQDPFASQYYYLDKYPKEDLVKFQSKVLSMADKIIVTEAIAKELKKNDTQLLGQKLITLNFPCIKKPNKTFLKEDISFNYRYINCVYVGKFNEDTRNPQMLLKLFENLNRDYIRLHIIGEEKDSWEKYLSVKQSNIFFYGMRSKEVAHNAELNSNILINLGNSVKNQLPSKLFEYISTGKPIINLYKIRNCPSLAYMEQYPICLNILENKKDQEESIRKIYGFCIRYRSSYVNYNYIRYKYYDCTTEYVSNEFLKIFDELMDV